MEHRYNTRVPIKMGVSVRYGPSGWSAGCVHNISTNGAYIAVTGCPFPVYAPLTLILDFHGSTGAARLEWPAMVVRTDDNGIGVMYLEMDTARADTLRWIIGQLLGDTPVEIDVLMTPIVPFSVAVAVAAEESTEVPQAARLRA